MAGLSLEAPYALVRECERRALESPYVPGTRRLALTPTDCRVLRSLCFDYHNGRTGRTDPGYRAIAKAATVALGTVGAAILGMILFQEPATALRIACIGLIVAGIVGLKAFS